MRRETPKPKVLELLLIPEDLRSFIQDVHDRMVIEDQSFREEADAYVLQCEFAYAGRENDLEYMFTYFPKQGVKTIWEIMLSPSEIERIAKGQVTQLKLWGCQNATCGSKFYREDYLCFYCDYTGE